MTVRMEAVGDGIIDAAQAEVKAWLRISMADDDEAIAALCRSAISMAEDFCARCLFLRSGAEVLAASHHWERMRSCPIRSVDAVRVLMADGGSTPLSADDYAVDIDAAGDGWVRVPARAGAGAGGAFSRIETAFTAGLAEGWADLPDALRQGVVRLAAHLFVHQQGDTAPPAIVTALWRPWRRMRLA